jgi:hypothetical protein
MTTCDLCGADLFRAESVALRACLECRIIIANENDESLSDKRRRVVAERMAQLEAGGPES